jgi:hypothetical protein
MPRRTAPALLLAAMAGALFLAAPGQVAACECAFTEPVAAARDADVVFIGTLAGTAGGGKPVAAGDTAWTWNVELSRSPGDPATITVVAPPNDGANCGVSFGLEERWLVMASSQDGVLRTSGCASNTPVDGAPEAYLEVIDALVPIGSAATGDAASSLPVPMLVLLGGVAVLIAVSALAFRERVR